MEFSAVLEPPGRHVVVRGEIDQLTAPLLREAMTSAAAGREALLLDLSAVQYLDLNAIRLLHEFAASTELEVMVAAGSAVDQVLRVCGLGTAARLIQVGPQ